MRDVDGDVPMAELFFVMIREGDFDSTTVFEIGEVFEGPSVDDEIGFDVCIVVVVVVMTRVFG